MPKPIHAKHGKQTAKENTTATSSEKTTVKSGTPDIPASAQLSAPPADAIQLPAPLDAIQTPQVAQLSAASTELSASNSKLLPITSLSLAPKAALNELALGEVSAHQKISELKDEISIKNIGRNQLYENLLLTQVKQLLSDTSAHLQKLNNLQIVIEWFANIQPNLKFTVETLPRANLSQSLQLSGLQPSLFSGAKAQSSVSDSQTRDVSPKGVPTPSL